MSLYEMHYVTRTTEQVRLKEQQQAMRKALEELSITAKLQQQQEEEKLLARQDKRSRFDWYRYLEVGPECRPYTPYLGETDHMTSTTCSSSITSSILTRQVSMSTCSFISESNEKIEIEERDLYGFKRPIEWVEAKELKEFDIKYKSILKKQSKSWNKLFDNNDQQWPSLCLELSRYVRYGVPQDIRTKAWMHYSGANNKMNQNQGLYQSLAQKPNDNTELERNLYHTFQDYVSFSEQIPSLRRILNAFCHYRSDITYTSSFNLLIGFLLILLKDEEQVFWLFVTTMEDYFPKEMFSQEGIEQTILMMMVYEKMPGVWSKISNKKCFWECEQNDSLPSVTLVTSHWFLNLFIQSLPVETVLRIWDCFFIGEGYKVLYQVALTMIKLNEQAIWNAKDSVDTIQILQNMPRRLIDCHEFIKSIFSPHGIAFDITMEEINRKRDLFRNRKSQRNK